MIVQPDFLEHWKTRQLVALTKDESAPLCIIRLWGHCQNSKRGTFPDMTSPQLDSICRWNNRKPACHTALIRCGFVEKMLPRGFIVHQWADHNRQLIQKWEAGKNGGRPKTNETSNELPLDDKPTGNRPTTARELDRTDGLDRPDQIDERRTEQSKAVVGSGSSFKWGSNKGSGPVRDYPEGGEPGLSEVQEHMESIVKGGSKFAAKWLLNMGVSGWTDDKGKPVRYWKPLAERWAIACEKNEHK